MKSCLCCKNTADDAAPTCPFCGEASFGLSTASPKPDGEGASEAKRGKGRKAKPDGEGGQ